MNVDSSVRLLIVQFAEISPSSPTISLQLHSAVQFLTRASLSDARVITVNKNNKDDRAICKKKKEKYHSNKLNSGSAVCVIKLKRQFRIIYCCLHCHQFKIDVGQIQYRITQCAILLQERKFINKNCFIRTQIRAGGKQYFKINRQLKERYRFVFIVLNRKRQQFCHNLVGTELGIEFLIPLEYSASCFCKTHLASVPNKFLTEHDELFALEKKHFYCYCQTGFIAESPLARNKRIAILRQNLNLFK